MCLSPYLGVGGGGLPRGLGHNLLVNMLCSLGSSKMEIAMAAPISGFQRDWVQRDTGARWSVSSGHFVGEVVTGWVPRGLALQALPARLLPHVSDTDFLFDI